MRKTVVHCYARKSDVVADDYENEHGPNTFVGSPEYHATLHADWRDGTCFLGHEHLGPHLFTDDKFGSEKERKAS